MKKLIFLELAILFLATTFSSNPPPGWYQQTLPVSDQINDIFFLDSLNGWAVTPSGYILNSTNGGDNWSIQKDSAGNLFSVQFLDGFTGYCLVYGVQGIIYKTTTGGITWNLVHNFSPAGLFKDISFVNKDTGWVCSIDPFDGGVFRTNDGGQSWQQQLNLGIGNPLKIFFVNKDTGWFANDFEQLYKTTNGGINWNGIFTSSYQIDAIFFLNGQKGWMRGGPNVGSIGVSYTTDGGFNWITSEGNTIGGFDVEFVNDSVGYAGTYSSFKVMKSIDGGRVWGFQNAPNSSDNLVATVKDDTLNAWAGQIIHTTDGGGNIILTDVNNNSSLVKNFDLHQNYPNPFNPKTVISYELRVTSYVKLKVYNVQGIEVKTLVNQRQNSGEYKTEFDGSGLNSGVYFYVFKATDEKSGQVFSETKNMVLVK